MSERSKRIEEAARALLARLDEVPCTLCATGRGPSEECLSCREEKPLRAALALPAEPVASAAPTRRNAPYMCACHDGTPMTDGRCQTCLLPVASAAPATPMEREARASIALDRDQTHYVGDDCPGGHASAAPASGGCDDECDECNGEGIVTRAFAVPHDQPCDACGGTGRGGK